MRLPAGQFLGQTDQRRQIAGLEIVSSTHSAGSSLAAHDHERPYFCLTLSGGYTERYGRRKRECGEHLVVFHPAGERHSQVHDSTVQTLNVEIDARWVSRIFDAVAALDCPSELRDDASISAASRIGLGAFTREPDAALALEADVWEILAAAASGRPSHGERRPRWLDSARELLRADFQHPIDFRQLAQHAGVHPVHFAATFRRCFGVSVGEYRRRLRLDFVQRRLHDPAPSLSEIAASAGFADQSHMTRAFKRYAGVTPAAYRSLLAFKTGPDSGR